MFNLSNLSKRNTIVWAIISVMVLVIGIVLIPASLILATVLVTLASISLVFPLFLLIKMFVLWLKTRTWPKYFFWKSLAVLTFVIAVIILIKVCGPVHFSDITIGDLHVSNVDLGNVDISKIDIDDADIGNLEISDTDIGHLEVSNADIGSIDISDADIGNLEISDADIGHLEVSDADIGSIDISDADIGNLEISDADIGHLEVSDVDIGNIDISDVSDDDTSGNPEHVCAVDESKTVTKAATCTEDGYVRKYCSCGKLISEKKIAATGHDYKEVGRKNPTSTEDGYIEYRCSKCSATTKDVLSKTGTDDPSDPFEFVIEIKGGKLVDGDTIVVGNEFEAIEVYTSGSVYDLVILQNQTVFNVTIVDEHHLILTVGDTDTYAKVRIYNPAYEDVIAVVIRISPVDPRA